MGIDLLLASGPRAVKGANVVLTRRGRQILMSQHARDDFQRLHAGLVNEREWEDIVR